MRVAKTVVTASRFYLIASELEFERVCPVCAGHTLFREGVEWGHGVRARLSDTKWSLVAFPDAEAFRTGLHDSMATKRLGVSRVFRF